MLTAKSARVHRLIHHRFEDYARGEGGALVAAEHLEKCITYGQLDWQASALAASLIANHPDLCGRKVFVGLLCTRSLEMIVGILAILKTGSAYVPIDGNLPADRIAYMLKATGAGIVLATSAALADRFNRPPQEQQHPHEEQQATCTVVTIPPTSSAAAAAYDSDTFDGIFNFRGFQSDETDPLVCIFTSGSTGKPKPVVLSHVGPVNLLDHPAGRLGAAPGRRCGQFMNIGFDVAVGEIFATLSNRATLVLRDDSNPFSIFPSLDSLTITPTGLARIDPASCPRLQHITVAGEQVPSSLVDKWAHLVTMYNGYGPSECSIIATFARLLPGEPVTIGKPVQNVTCHVVGPDGIHVTPGTPGELWIAGVGVSTGYLGLDKLTAERFLPNPFAGEGGLIYRTGDQVQLTPDGDLKCLGRLDNQIKLKGYRMELDEINHAMQDASCGVNIAVTIVVNQTLHAFVTPANVDTINLRKVIGEKLPAYMVPATITTLNSMPMSQNEKVDTKALATLVVQGENSQVSAPINEREFMMREIFAHVLDIDVETIGRDSPFLSLGGDSITVLQVVSLARMRGFDVTLVQLYELQTVARLAAECGMIDDNHNANSEMADDGNDDEDGQSIIPLTPVQHWFLDAPYTPVNRFKQSSLWTLREAIHPDSVRSALEKLVRRHDVLYSTFSRSSSSSSSVDVWEHRRGARPDVAVPFVFTELALASSSIDHLASAVEDIDALIDVGRGTLMAVALLKSDDRTSLYLTINHLVVDYVSWRVIAEELQSLLHGSELPPPSMPFRSWARHQRDSAKMFRAEEWINHIDISDNASPLLRADRFASQHTTIKVNVPASAAVLNTAVRAYRSNVQELVLAALTKAYQIETQAEFLPMHMEGHGREALGNNAHDVSRTVGWFTTIYPVKFAIVDGAHEALLSEHDSDAAHICSVKETLRGIPDKGISYGILRYHADANPNDLHLSRIKQHSQMHVLFNYHGQFQALGRSDSMFERQQGLKFVDRETDADSVPRAIEINVFFGANDELIMELDFDSGIYDLSTVDAWARGWTVEMTRVVQHCLQVDAEGGSFTPSDFTLSHIGAVASQKVLDHLRVEHLSGLGLVPVDCESVMPTTPLQAGFILALAKDPSQYLIQCALSISGDLDVDRFKAAWATVARRDPIHRTTFAMCDSAVYQVVLRQAANVFEPQLEWTSAENREEFLVADRNRGFDLGARSLMRCTLAKMKNTTGNSTEASWEVVWTVHHALVDATSIRMFWEDFWKAYAGLDAGSRARPSFKVYLEHLAEVDAKSAAAEAFWTTHLRDLFPVAPLSLIDATVKDANPSKRMMQREDTLDVSMADLARFCSRNAVTATMVLQLAHALLVRTYTGRSQIVWGNVVSGRGNHGHAKIRAPLINTIVSRLDMEADTTVSELLKALRTFQAASAEYELTPLSDIQRWSSLDSGVPLFDTIFTCTTTTDGHPSTPEDLPFKIQDFEIRETTDVPLGISFGLSTHSIKTVLHHHTSSVGPEVAGRMVDKLTHILQTLIRTEKTLTVDDLCSPDPKDAALARLFEAGPVEEVPFRLLHHAFEQHAQIAPHFPAVEFEGQMLTYGELDIRANAVAHALISAGTTSGTLVGVYTTRRIEMVVGCLGVLKAGGTFCILNSDLPVKRIEYYLDELQCKVLVCASRNVVPSADVWKGTVVIAVDEILKRDLSPVEMVKPDDAAIEGHHPAYAQFSSGSTASYTIGQPKGVLIPHKGITNSTYKGSMLCPKSGVRVAQFMSISFDGCLFEIFNALSNGNTLVLCGPDPLAAIRTVEAMISTPTGLRQFTAEDLKRVRNVASAGEACPENLVAIFGTRDDLTFRNLFGPCEVSIMSSGGTVTPGHFVHVGKPIRNSFTYILDDRLRPCPVGAVGEIFLAGAGVGIGYLNRPELNAEKFLTDPFRAGRMYRTGDRGRWTADGNIHFLGRVDDQVKLRGYRIEIEEIATVLQRFPGVEATALVVDNNILTAFVTPHSIDVAALRKLVCEYLPAYMVPSSFIPMIEIPMTHNGKADKAKLLKTLALSRSQIAVPTAEKEITIAGAMASVLNLDPSVVGLHTSFFAMGGDSISSISLSTTCKRLGLAISVAQIFECQTVGQLAMACTPVSQAPTVSQTKVVGQIPLTPIQRWFFELELKDPHQFKQSWLLKPRDRVNPTSLRDALQHLVDHHDMLRVRFDKAQSEDKDDAWVQITDPVREVDVVHVNATVAQLPRIIPELVQRLDMQSQTMVCALIETEHGQRIFWAIHHLVVDLVSWRILMDDLAILLERPESALEMKTTSFQEWAGALTRWAPDFAPEKWHEHLDVSPVNPFPAPDGTQSERRVVVLPFDPELSDALDLGNSAYRTNNQELLLTAGLKAFSRSTGVNKMSVYLEGHGRETLIDITSIDLTRTVGWFTTLYPVTLNLPASSDPASVLKATKETLRRVPEKGLSYGAIRHLAEPTDANVKVKSHALPWIRFNYLGRFQNLDRDEAMFAPDPGYSESDYAADEEQLYIDINCSFDSTRALCIEIAFDASRFDASLIGQWGERWSQEVRALAEHCRISSGGFTRSDFSLISSDDVLDEIARDHLSLLKLEPREVADVYPVSPLQAGFAVAMLRNPSDYILQSVFVIRGEFDEAAFRNAWATVASANAILRTVFASTSEGVFQLVRRDIGDEGFYPMMLNWKEDAAQACQKQFLNEDRLRGFALTDRVFNRHTLVRISEHEHLWIWTGHHITQDGFSRKLFLSDMVNAYEGKVLKGRPDFKLHIASILSVDTSSTETFWREHFQLTDQAHEQPLPLPAPHGAPAATDETEMRYLEIKRKAPFARDHLQRFCTAHGVTISTLIRAVWAVVVRQYHQTDDVVFGSVVSGREGDIEDVDRIMGVFINTVAVRVVFAAEETFSSLLQRLHEFHIKSLPHSHASLVDVTRWANRSGEGLALFDTLIEYQNFGTPDGDKVSALTLEPVDFYEMTEYSLSMSFVAHETLEMTAAYDRMAVSEDVVGYALASFENVLESVLSSLNVDALPVSQVSAMAKEEADILHGYTRGKEEPIEYLLLHGGVEKHAAAPETANLVAVQFGDVVLTYRDLDNRGNAVARAVLGYGIQRSELVALFVSRSLEMCVGIIGILKAGAAYVPIDSGFPSDRVQYIIEETKARLVLTTVKDLALVPTEIRASCHIVILDGFTCEPVADEQTMPLNLDIKGSDLAYAIFTSGTTGKPKGVLLDHSGPVNNILVHPQTKASKPGMTVGQFMAVSFDALIHEYACAWFTGATLVLREENMFDTLPKINSICFTPTGLLQADPAQYPNLRHMIVSGEACPETLLARWGHQTEFYSDYGPTECSITSTCTDPLKVGDPISIGRPLSNTTAYILDAKLQPVPIGVRGQLYLGGAGVARGYLNRPELTAEKFVADSFLGGDSRMYATGDSARFVSSGNLVFEGRQDDQVKIKGYRVEPNEIQLAVRAFPEVTDAVVLARNNMLHCFVTPEDVDKEAIRAHLILKLPHYMIPSTITSLAVFETNANGKVDKSKLEVVNTTTAITRPSTAKQTLMAQMMAKVLNIDVDTIGQSSSFFALGGDSISCMSLVTACKRVGLGITVGDVFKNPTLAALATAAATKAGADQNKQTMRPPVTGKVALTPIQHAFFLEKRAVVSHYNQSFLLKNSRHIQFENLKMAVRQLLDHHAMLRATYEKAADGAWTQSVPSTQRAVRVTHVTVQNDAERDDSIRRLSGSLNIENGDVFVACLFEMNGQQSLFLAAHHLVVDLVSFRIIFEHLEMLLTGNDLPERTTSFQEWAGSMEKLAPSLDPTPWLPLTAAADSGKHFFACAHPQRLSSVRVLTTTLSGQVSASLDNCNIPYRTNIQDLVCAALAVSFAEVSGCSQLPVLMERHGRESWHPSLDVTGTVGWFTITHPVLLTAEIPDDVGAVIFATKTSIRSVSNALSWGVIRHVAPSTPANAHIKQKIEPVIAVNYLGRFHSTESGAFFQTIPSTDGWNEDSVQSDAIEVNCYFDADNSLTLHISFDSARFDERKLKAWGESWSDAMKSIVSHCEKSDGRLFSADYPSIEQSVVGEIEELVKSTLELAPKGIEDIFPATPMQTDFLYALASDPQAFVSQTVYELQGHFDPSRFTQAMREVAVANTTMRTAFVITSDAKVYQVVTSAPQPIVLPTLTWEEGSSDQALTSLLETEMQRGFTLRDRSMLRIVIAQIGSTSRYHVVWMAHHSILDGLSISLLMNDIWSVYAGALPQIRPSTKFHAEALQKDLVNGETFWKQVVEQWPSSAPFSFKDVKQQAPSYKVLERYIDLAPSALLKTHSASNVTISAVLLVAWAVVLRHYQRVDDLTFGTVMSGREGDIDDIELMMGNLIFTVPVRLHLDDQMTLTDALLQARDYNAKAMTHPVSSRSLRQWAGADASTALFTSLLSIRLSRSGDEGVANRKLSFSMHEKAHSENAGLPLALTISPQRDSFALDISYDENLLNASEVNRVIDKLEETLRFMARSTSNSIGELDQLSLEDRKFLEAVSSSANSSGTSTFSCIHHAFEMQARVRPETWAVEHYGRALTYGELNHRADQLAQVLRAKGAAKRNVGLLIERSIEMVIGILAILKAGAACVPLDVDFPAEHIKYVFEEASCNIVLTMRGIKHHILDTHEHVIFIEDPDSETDEEPCQLEHAGQASDVAFVVFTSGSSGKPKGVELLHGGISRLFDEPLKTKHIVPGWRFAHTLSVAFDGSLGELFFALTQGATTVLREEDLFKTLRTVDILHTTPSGLRQLSRDDIPNVKLLFVGAEPLPPSLAAKWCSEVILINLYGPTETSLYATGKQITPGSEVTIGKPVANTSIYILDVNGKQVPRGICGEIFIGGTGVAKGYLNLPDLTKEKFVPDAFRGGNARMYASGDIARWLESGELEYSRRIENSFVKLKGYRVEVQAVTRALEQHAGVTGAAAWIKDGILLGAVTPASIDGDKAIATTATLLPAYAVPERVLTLDEMPMTRNGKIDMKALEAMDTAEDGHEPRTPDEIAMASIWAQVLKKDVSVIGCQTSFFSVGGDSMSAIRLVHAANAAGLEFTVQDLFKIRKLGPLVELCARSRESAARQTTVTQPLTTPAQLEHLEEHAYKEAGLTKHQVEDVYPCSPVATGMLLQLMKDPSKYVVNLVWEVPGMVDLSALKMAWTDVIKKHQVLRSRFLVGSQAVFQVVLKDPEPFSIKLTNAASFEEPRLALILQKELSVGFLHDDILFRINVFSAPRAFRFCLTVHHAYYDGFSAQILLEDMKSSLGGIALGHPTSLRPYFAHLHQRDAVASASYWQQVMDGVTPSKALSCATRLDGIPTDTLFTFKTEASYIRAFCQLADTTAPILVKAVWALVYGYYQDTADVLFGEVVSGRDVPVENVLGMAGLFINTLPVRARIEDQMSLRSLLADLAIMYSSAIPYSQFSLAEIAKVIKHDSMTPLVHTALVFQNIEVAEASSCDENWKRVTTSASGDTNEFEMQLSFSLGDNGEGLSVDIEAAASIEPSDIQRMMEAFDGILLQIVTNPTTSLGRDVKSFSVLTKQVEQDILRLGAGEIKSTPFSLLHHGLEHHAVLNPAAVALEHDDLTMTYAQLDAQANRCARALRAAGVNPGTLVPYIICRSIESIVGFFAILKAGGVYIPIDHEFPAERINKILNVAKSPVLLCMRSTQRAVQLLEMEDRDILVIEDLLAAAPEVCGKLQDEIAPHDLCVGVFTSGTTGVPKMVRLKHAGIVNLVTIAPGSFDMGPSQRIGHICAVGFDVAIGEIQTGICNGGTVVIRGQDLQATLHKIDVLFTTPTGILSCSPDDYPNLKTIFVTGELCPPSLKDAWAGRVRFFNGGSPTELSITTHIGLMDPQTPVHIGPVLPNVYSMVLNKDRKLIPLGCVGELYTGGVGLSDGYHGLPELTAEKYVSNPYGPGLLFRTGDGARLRADGTFEHLGRLDNNGFVKHLGYRIELSEITHALCSFPGLRGAVALTKDRKLIAYVMPESVDIEGARKHIATKLPAYMQPSVIIPLAEFPMTTNGKVDKGRLSSLPMPDDTPAPRNTMETRLRRLFATVLNLDESVIGIHSSYFSLGGDSLNAIALVTQGRRSNLIFSVGQLFNSPTIAALALLVDNRSEVEKAPLPVETNAVDRFSLVESAELLWEIERNYLPVIQLPFTEVEDIYPCLPLQEGFLTAMQRDRESYVGQSIFEGNGNTEIATLRHAWAAVAARNPILRTSFVSTSRGAYQVVRKTGVCPFPENWIVVEEADLSRVEKELLLADKRKGFTFTDAAFTRFHLLKVAGTDRYRFIWTIFHGLEDALSLQNMLVDWISACRGKAISARLPIKTHVEFILGLDEERTRAFWQAQLEGSKSMPSNIFQSPSADAVNTLPASMNAPAVLTATCSKLLMLSRDLNVTLSTVLRAAWALTLKHFMRTDHVAFGSIVSGRDCGYAGAESILGPMINTIAVAVATPDSASFQSVVQALHQFQAASIEHVHAPLWNVKKWCGLRSGDNLFNTIFNVRNFDLSDFEELEVEDGKFSPRMVAAEENTDVPVAVALDKVANTMELLVTYDTKLTSSSDISRLIAKFDETLSAVVANGAVAPLPIRHLNNIRAAEEKLLRSFESGTNAKSRFLGAHTGFWEHVEAQPHSIAVEEGDLSLTYLRLSERVRRLQHALLTRTNAKGPLNVALFMPRSLNFVSSILAVLQTGFTYVPIDPALPSSRIEYILHDAECALVLTTAPLASALPEAYRKKSIEVDTWTSNDMASVTLPQSSPDDVAFITYTSGSSGTPKGVKILHRGLIRLLDEPLKTQHVTPGVRCASFMSIGFDAAQFEVLLALTRGATLVLKGSDPMATIRSVDVLHITPTGLAHLDPASFANLRVIFVGSEPLPFQLARQWAAKVKLINLYGPTECSCFATGKVISADVASPADITVGKPLNATRVYVLDDLLDRAPIGIAGQVYIGGDAVGDGYLGLDDQNATKFIRDPFSSGKLYATGDKGCFTANGELRIFGRLDDMRKIKGYRVELSDVELALQASSEVSGAVAVVKNDTLICFVTPATVDVTSLRGMAIKTLPHYAVPTAIYAVAEFAVNANGKACRKTLAQLTLKNATAETRTPAEDRLAAIWASVLKTDAAQFSPTSSFFEHGGDSISVLQMVNAAKVAGFSLTTAEAFSTPTLSSLALKTIESQVHRAASDTIHPVPALALDHLDILEANGIDASSVESMYRALPLQEGMFSMMLMDQTKYVVHRNFTVDKSVATDQLQEACQKLTGLHGILRTTFAQTDQGLFQ
ncbi:hypothetical protein HDU89_006650, partial [Geranomyces variabilis]